MGSRRAETFINISASSSPWLIRYLDNQRNMADELFDGNIASEMTLGEAIVCGILNPPKYVLSIFSCQDSLVKYEMWVKKAQNKAVKDKERNIWKLCGALRIRRTVWM